MDPKQIWSVVEFSKSGIPRKLISEHNCESDGYSKIRELFDTNRISKNSYVGLLRLFRWTDQKGDS